MLHAVGYGEIAGVPVVAALGLVSVAVSYVRGFKATRDVTRPVAFAAAWLVLGIALASPLHEAGEQHLSLHMVQHVLIMAVAAPLLVLSAPVATLLRGLPHGARVLSAHAIRTIAPLRKRMSALWTAAVLQMVVLWAWHLPALYQAGVANPWIHAVQHSTLLISAILFWMSLPLRRTDHGRLMAGIASLFMTTMQMGILSALFTFSRLPWYPVYVTHGAAAAVADQQIAGLIMWVPGALPYIAAALALVWRIMRHREWHAPAILNQPLPQRSARVLIVLCVAMTAVAGSACENGASYKEGSLIGHGNAHRGQTLIRDYGCRACHLVPGVPGGTPNVGPDLTAFRNRMYIGGVMPNSPENLQKWIEDPKAVDTLTAMPNLGVSPNDARDIASYLYSLK